jgi:RND superfamily putative drug exporter
MELLGERNWYLPPWLRWLPDAKVDGAEPPTIRSMQGALPPT